MPCSTVTRRRLTPARMQRVFGWWRDQMLKKPRKRNERFDWGDIWFGIRLSLTFRKKDPEHFSDEWAAPAIKTLELLGQTLLALEGYPKTKPGISEKEKVRCAQLIEQLDWTVAMIGHELDQVTYGRALHTRNDDLALDLLHKAIGKGGTAVELLRRIQRDLPHVDGIPGGTLDGENTVASFAWDTYIRVALLDQLVEEFPDHLRPVARQMHAWPVLRHRHTAGGARFEAVADKLELGADYPLDTRRAARFRPDSPMVQYLDVLMPRLVQIRQNCRFHNTTSEQDLSSWWTMDSGREATDPSSATLQVLARAKNLPPLTKGSAAEWTKKLVVPLILATDARGNGPYVTAALEQIRRQRDIKSRAIFQSRLESKVAKTLRSLAKPA